MTFKVVIHPEPTGGYWGEVPALPGCYSQGETVEELLANLREPLPAVSKFWPRRAGRQTPKWKWPNSRYEANNRQGTLPAFERGGLDAKTIKGSHHIFGKPGERKVIAVPVHGNQTIKPGLALRIAKDAGISW